MAEKQLQSQLEGLFAGLSDQLEAAPVPPEAPADVAERAAAEAPVEAVPAVLDEVEPAVAVKAEPTIPDEAESPAPIEEAEPAAYEPPEDEPEARPALTAEDTLPLAVQPPVAPKVTDAAGDTLPLPTKAPAQPEAATPDAESEYATIELVVDRGALGAKADAPSQAGVRLPASDGSDLGDQALPVQVDTSGQIRLETAAQVSHAITSILDLEALLPRVVDMLRQSFDLYYVGIFLVDLDGTRTGEPDKWAILRAGTGNAGRTMMAQNHKLRVGGASMIGTCIAAQGARIALDVGSEAVRFDNPALPLTRSEMALPLVSRDQAIGAMTVQSQREAAFSRQDIAVLQTVADQLANAIQNARLFSEAERRLRELGMLSEVSREFAAASLEAADISRIIAEQYVRAMNVPGCSISLLDPLSETLEIVADCRMDLETKEIQQESIGETWSLRDFPASARVISEVQPTVIQASDPDADPHELADMRIHGTLTLAIFPLITKGQAIGVIELEAVEQEHVFSQEEIDLGMTLANQAAAALQNARLYEAMIENTREMEILSHLASVTSQSLELDQMVQAGLEAITRLTGFEAGLVSIDRENNGKLELVLQKGLPEPMHQRLLEDGLENTLCDYVFQRGVALTIGDMAEQSPVDVQGALAHGLRSYVGVPIAHRGRNMGTLGLFSRTTHAAIDISRDLLVAVGNQVGVGISNATLFGQTQQSLTEIATLHQLATVTNQSLDLEQMLVASLDSVIALTGFEAGLVSLVNPTTEKLELSHQRELPEPLEQKLLTDGMDGTLCDYVFQRGEMLTLGDMKEAAPMDVQGLLTLGLQSYVGIPLFQRSEILGTLCLFSQQTQSTEQMNLQLLQAVGSQVAIGVANAQLYEQTRRRAQEMAILNELGQALSSQLELRQVLDETYRGVARLLDTSNFYIGLYDPDRYEISFPVNITRSRIDQQIVVIPADAGLSGYVIRTKKGLLIERDVAEWQRERGMETVGEPAQSWLGVPLMVGSQVLGIMAIQSYSTPYRYNRRDLELFTAIANQSAVALQNAKLYAEAQRRAESERRVRTATDSIHRASGLEEIMQVTLRQLSQFLDSSEAVIRLGSQLESLSSGQAGLLLGLRDEWSAYLSRPENARGYYVTEKHHGPTSDAWLPGMSKALGAGRSTLEASEDGASLAAPVRLAEDLLGVMGFYGPAESSWDRDALAEVEALAEQTALALESQRLFDETRYATSMMSERVRELDLLNDIGRQIDDRPSVPEFLDWVAGRIPAAMKQPEICTAAIAYGEAVYGNPEATELPHQTVGSIRVVEEIVGRVYIAYRAKRQFVDTESMLLGDIVRRVSGYLENRLLVAQAQDRAHREQTLSEITTRVRGSTDPTTIMRTAARELGTALGRQVFVRLGTSEQLAEPPSGNGSGAQGGE